MDTQGRLTAEDGQAYTDFCERWGETPQGDRLVSCLNCAYVVGHHPECTPAARQRLTEWLINDLLGDDL